MLTAWYVVLAGASLFLGVDQRKGEPLGILCAGGGASLQDTMANLDERQSSMNAIRNHGDSSYQEEEGLSLGLGT